MLIKKALLSICIFTTLLSTAGCEDKEAKAMIERQAQIINQLTTENTQLKEKNENLIPAILVNKEVIFEKLEKINYPKSQEHWFDGHSAPISLNIWGLKTNIPWLNELLWTELMQSEFSENTPKTREQAVARYETLFNQIKSDMQAQPEIGFSRNAWLGFIGQKEKLSTFFIGYYSYEGGAHGVGGKQYLTVDMNRRQVVNFSDVFDEKKLPEIKELLWRIYTDFGNVNEEQVFTPKADFEVSKNFCLAHDGVHFIYHVYEIAPYVAGEQDLTVSWDWFLEGNLLKPEFIQQQYYDLTPAPIVE